MSRRLTEKLLNLEQVEEIQELIDTKQNLFDVLYKNQQPILQNLIFIQEKQLENNNDNNNCLYQKEVQDENIKENVTIQKEELKEIEKAEIETNSSSQNALTEQSKKYSCKCKKSQCLRMYCECFNNDGYCGKDCTCENCKNQPENDKLRAEAILYLKNKYPEIKRKLENQQKQIFKPLHCNCKKSSCKKKYCECYFNGKKCGKYCNCVNCSNIIQDNHKQNQNYNNSFIQNLYQQSFLKNENSNSLVSYDSKQKKIKNQVSIDLNYENYLMNNHQYDQDF